MATMEGVGSNGSNCRFFLSFCAQSFYCGGSSDSTTKGWATPPPESSSFPPTTTTNDCREKPYLLLQMSQSLEVVASDQLGRKVRVNCNPEETIADLKKYIAAQIGADWTHIQLKKWSTLYRDHIALRDYEISNGMNLELYEI